MFQLYSTNEFTAIQACIPKKSHVHFSITMSSDISFISYQSAINDNEISTNFNDNSTELIRGQ